MNITITQQEKQNHNWYLIDAKGKTLGRTVTIISKILRGKNNPNYSPSQDCKDYVIVINTQDIEVSGKKKYQKVYRSHTGRPGSLRTETFENLQERLPNRIVENAIKRMLPKNAIGRKVFKHLKLYPNHKHPHTAQNPINIEG
uniref:Large ribosomal subunit protein uL13c n=1 Tax=Scinaia undulata TaxID=1884664 RepID=A0A1G4NXS0_9FLOR|nr:Ribosomal protein L13 [Scinaia undulata]SCW23452.1 Ribosomal protein L13 [Scinaia undulata]